MVNMIFISLIFIILGILVIIFAKSITRLYPKTQFFPKYSEHVIKKMGGYKYFKFIGILIILIGAFILIYNFVGGPNKIPVNINQNYLFIIIVLVFLIIVFIFWSFLKSYNSKNKRR